MTICSKEQGDLVWFWQKPFCQKDVSCEPVAKHDIKIEHPRW